MTSPESSGASTGTLAGEYFAWHARREFRLQRCQRCKRWTHPPTEMCAACGSVEMAWERASGEGILYTWTVTHHPYTAPLAEFVPYPLVVVQCAEGPRVLSTVMDLEGASLTPGMALTVRFAAVGGGPLRAVFAPVAAQEPDGLARR